MTTSRLIVGVAATLILDLDGRGEDSINGALAMEGQKTNDEFVKLERRLGSCNKCGPGKWCKINKLGTHVHLTAAAWGMGPRTGACFFLPI